MTSKNAIRPENLHVAVLGFRTTQYDKKSCITEPED
jgi:hypothetical protein